MDLRLALYELSAAHGLDAAAARRLQQLAGLSDAPALLAQRVSRGVAVAAAALAGLGVVFWIAAQWGSLGRGSRFALLQALVLAACVAAWARPAARVPLGLLVWLGIGGLFAFFGQTYQTGADPWQLFALWAALALPLALGLRSDVVWTPWALVALTAISLWVHAHTGHRWRVEPHDLQAHALGWAAALLLVAALGPELRRYSGAGPWSLRTALTLAVVMVTLTAVGGLLHKSIAPHYGLGLGVLAALAMACAWPRRFEVYGLSAAALSLNVLLIAGLSRLLFEDFRGGDPRGRLLLIGLVAAALLAGTVHLVLRLARRAAPEPRS
jgi:uncharacterized membrane protein